MKKTFIVATVLSVLMFISAFFLFYKHKTVSDYYVIINDKKFDVTLADTNALRIKGLSGTQNLEDQTGMLFVFEHESEHGFWMKDMNYAIDIIWISATKDIVFIEHSAKPESYPNVFSSVEVAQYVLEVNSDTAKNNGIKIGDKINFSNEIEKRLKKFYKL